MEGQFDSSARSYAIPLRSETGFEDNCEGRTEGRKKGRTEENSIQCLKTGNERLFWRTFPAGRLARW